MNIDIPKERRNTITSMMYEAEHQPMTSLPSKRHFIDDPGKVAISQYHCCQNFLLRNSAVRIKFQVISVCHVSV